MAGHGGDVDDAAAGFGEVADGSLAAEGEGEDVDAPHFFPVCGVTIDDVGEVGHAGAVDEAVDFSEVLEDGGDVFALGEVCL